MTNYHIPVMLNEVLEYLDVLPGRWYVDCNLGGGGHTEGILAKGGKVIGIDLDPESIMEVGQRKGVEVQREENGLRGYSENLILVQGNFADIKQLVEEVSKESEVSKISGVLFDLGVSSHQLETAKRGFSFNLDAPLDMRMDTSKEMASAADLINGLHEGELTELFGKLGEENFAKPIARKIVQERQKQKIETTSQLTQIILSVRKRSSAGRIHPATRVFQALRIAVNDELNSLRKTLPQVLEILEPGGKLVVISFHSLEDRIVKEFMKDAGLKGWGSVITKKPIEPTEDETKKNPRSRSGKLRVLKKLL